MYSKIKAYWASLVTADGATLKIYNLVFFGILFYHLFKRQVIKNFDWVPLELWQPNGISGLTQFMSGANIATVYGLLLVLIFLSAIHLLPSIIKPLTFLLFFLLVGYSQSFGYFTRLYMPIVWVMFFIALDAGLNFVQKEYTKDQNRICFNILFARIIFTTVFFSAGLSKIINSGFEWQFGETLKNYLIVCWTWQHELKYDKILSIGQLMLNNDWIIRLSAPIVVIVELLTPLALISSRAARILIPALLAMQQIFKHTILVNFDLYWAIYFFWMPPEFINQRLIFLIQLSKKIRDNLANYAKKI